MTVFPLNASLNNDNVCNEHVDTHMSGCFFEKTCLFMLPGLLRKNRGVTTVTQTVAICIIIGKIIQYKKAKG